MGRAEAARENSIQRIPERTTEAARVPFHPCVAALISWGAAVAPRSDQSAGLS
jgi:hypothetical protein